MFCENNYIIVQAQFGVLKGFLTIDAIYILMSIVKRFINIINVLTVLIKISCGLNFKTGFRVTILQMVINMY